MMPFLLNLQETPERILTISTSSWDVLQIVKYYCNFQLLARRDQRVSYESCWSKQVYYVSYSWFKKNKTKHMSGAGQTAMSFRIICANSVELTTAISGAVRDINKTTSSIVSLDKFNRAYQFPVLCYLIPQHWALQQWSDAVHRRHSVDWLIYCLCRMLHANVFLCLVDIWIGKVPHIWQEQRCGLRFFFLAERKTH